MIVQETTIQNVYIKNIEISFSITDTYPVVSAQPSP